MKLLICTQVIDKNDPILGFFHRWVVEFAKHFEHIYVICLKEGTHTLPKNVTVLSLGKGEKGGDSRLKYFIRFYTFFFKAFFHIKVDIVFFHMGAIYNILALPFFLIRKLQKTKFIWWKTHGLLNAIGRLATYGVDEIVTAGSNSFNSTTNKVRVIGHAIDTDVFTYRERTNENLTLKVLSVGRITPIKKIEIAIQAISTFRKKSNDRILLDVYGPETDLLYKEKLVTKVEQEQATSCVKFFSSQYPEHMPNIYQQYDILMHPAYEAGFDKVVLEAMATGVIPITSIKSFEPILKPFDLYVEEGNVEKYATVAYSIQNMSSSDRGILRKKLRQIILSSHSINSLPERIFNVV